MSKDGTIAGGSNSSEIMLFGVRVVVDAMRKSVSLNNLSQYEHRLDSSSSNDVVPPAAAAGGYASADEAVVNHSTATVNRDRKRGVPWTEEEHKLFLQGLQKVGKGDWRGISRNFVKTRTPTQVASHAQKYFLRRSNLNRRRRRSSLFDITTDTVAANPTNDQQICKDNNGGHQSPSPQLASSTQANSEVSNIRFLATPIYPLTTYNPVVDQEMKVVRPTSRETMADLDLNKNSLTTDPSPLSLKLSLSMSSDLASSSSSSTSSFRVVQGFNNGDSIIMSVA